MANAAGDVLVGEDFRIGIITYEPVADKTVSVWNVESKVLRSESMGYLRNKMLPRCHLFSQLGLAQ